MRYNEIMIEVIQNKPHHLGIYLRNRIKELGQMLDTLAQAQTLIKSSESGHGIVRHAMRYGIEGTSLAGTDDEEWVLEDFNLDREFEITRLRDSLESYLQFGNKPGYDFLKYVMSTLADATAEKARQGGTWHQRSAIAFQMLPYVEAGFKIYGYEPGNPEHEADEEYIAAKNLLTAYRLKAKVFARIGPMEDDMRAKLSVIQRMMNFRIDPHKYRPEHGDVETLYHATAFVRDIVRDGFQAEKPAGRVGLGSFGNQQLISFTHDLEVARTIMRSFKEIWMITHHQLSGQQILSWARAEGVENDVRQAWRNDTSDPMPLGRAADPRETVKLYRKWQWFSKVRENPVMTSPWEIVDIMVDRTLKDIGVISCSVNLTGDYEYLHGESEFRLSADRVIPGTIKQIL
jgi:hypothetical protein